MAKSHFLPLALTFIHCFMVSHAMIERNLTTDQHLLLQFKRQTVDPHNILANSWTATRSICDWIGVSCAAKHGRVQVLDLSYMNLTGTISPALGNLSFLASLNLSGNGFHGDLPSELGQLSRLKIMDLSFNSLTGEIPSSFGRVNQMIHLKLRNNSLSGAIPRSIGNISSMEILELTFNSIQGDIPREIGSLVNLRRLRLGFNKLSGSIPYSIYSMSRLQYISLTENSLSGQIPDDICHHLPNLQILDLRANKFSGQIPTSVNECRNLVALALDLNQLSGGIPTSIGNLTALQELTLDGNHLGGEIPWEIGNLVNLQIFSAINTTLTGHIPRSIGNLSSLIEIYLGPNKLQGEIPEEIGNLGSLEIFSLANMSLTGVIPPSLFNISSLREIYLQWNQLSGKLPEMSSDSNLEELHLWGNNLSGNIPESICNVSKLTHIALGANSFSGHIPKNLGNLRFLQDLLLWKNKLTTNGEWSFFPSLLNCTSLITLDLSVNPLSGVLPTSISNLPASLQSFSVADCNIGGTIPMEIGDLNNVIMLQLNSNKFIGSIPASIARLKNLQLLSLDGNKLQGSIPHDLCGLNRLYELTLDDNELDGPLPACLSELTSLRKISLSYNKFHSSIPSSFWSLKDILEVDLSFNNFNGLLPSDIGNLKVVNRLDLSGNFFSSDIPPAIGSLHDVQALVLSHNRLQGPIPESLGDLLSLKRLDLSDNDLSGVIPESLEKLRDLEYFNVSVNRLEGEIPSEGPFSKFTDQSFAKNFALCGSPRFRVSRCVHRHHRKTPLQVLRYVLPTFASIIILAAFIVVCIQLKKRKKKKKSTDLAIGEDAIPLKEWKRISYDQLSKGTEGFSEANILGSGSFGTVYRGQLSDGKQVAVKVFDLQTEGAFKSFDVECQVMSKIIHRNLVKVITCCSNPDFKALVLEFMPNGSLEKWLYSANHSLDILQRINIMIDVASALEYLHSEYSVPIIHCDLKPSNVLLDRDMVAHVGDFGIAKLLGGEDSIKQTMTLATIGYMAPEYGSAGIISVKSDVYSYGVLLMETFTRKKPTDEVFVEEMSLKRWVEMSLCNGIMGAGDSSLVQEDDEYFVVKANCISSIIKLALDCSAELPEDRTDMKNVISMLRNIKRKFLNDVAQD
ncbi:Detected protein of confused Function [Hibiscus syriacus]|uniref:non-specific serine/threonine protein kinase n=1 Tax=Hibiscus syriacus TaxID=106335 RepID=A0A6A3BA38_HIBSY|nr:receptor kinase-like protein Xa21 isoform X1 [Hibiscus syriacus]KAE8713874.1 Detected protein of confused Function [Hibiscus syriacus]